MKLSFRIGVPRYQKEQQFQELLAFLSEHRECVDELTLFTEYWHHGYYPLDTFGELCLILADRIERLRTLGFTNVGINMLDTLGHLDEAWDWLAKLPYQPVVAWDGKLSTSSFCPNSEEFRSYIAEKYRLTALAKPDFIWVDDDIRMFSLGVDYACFCPECLRIYNSNHGSAFSREELANILNSKEGADHRERWVQQNIDTIERLMAHIAEAVHAVDASIELGLMTVSLGISTYTGADYKKWFTALKAVKGRPGGGFFEDSQPFSFIRKMFEVNRQISHYPDTVTDIQYELENFPYQALSKSISIMMLECTSAMMIGNHGIAFNTLKGEEGSLEEYHEIMRNIKRNKPRWAEMDRIAGSYQTAGLETVLSPLFEAKRSLDDGSWFEKLSVDSGVKSYVLSEIGLPLATSGAASCATVLAGKMPEAFSNEELIGFLSRGLLLDGKALEILIARGLGSYCGVEIDKTYDNGVFECFTEDPLNGENHGERRDARNSMSKIVTYTLRPLQDEARVLSRLISFTDDDLGPASSVYENSLGGRVAVQGYVPWQLIHSAVKRSQLIQICDWLSYGRLPIVIDECRKIVPFIKQSADGQGWFLMLLNATYDETGLFTAKLRYSANDKPVFELLEDGSSVQLQSDVYEKSANEIRLTVHNMGSWKNRIFYQQ